MALRFHRLWFLLGGLLLAGCRTAAPPPTPPPPDLRERLMAAVARWQGTPHRWGGLDHRGIDCSGLVLRVYQEAFGLTLPRTTEAQAQLGRPVPRQAWQAGDLVFFRFNRKERHVGIYLGDGRFVHASSSQGVTISTLNDPYWHRHYWMARRILPPETAPLYAPSPKPTIGW
ncbi:C40 family peptidase [Rhodothermus profundi]|uniref:Probable lipoprotein NlpC n=1 Tax=Rhodothermus profundi TaxID=633813 RepID=A0A1M6XGN3_9BACT|nr:NlpC/P60 family protein [Rhodothermus profundi]SHL05180.1 probable lipoprotein NlpC [Rhodothermus profundi]